MQTEEKLSNEISSTRESHNSEEAPLTPQKDLPQESKESIESIELQKGKTKRHIRWMILFLSVFLISCALFMYFYGTYYYGEHFFSNTVINGTLCKNLTYEEALTVLREQYNSSYCLILMDKEGNEAFRILPDEVGMTFSLDEGVLSLFREQNKYNWIYHFFSKDQDRYEVPFTVSYDEQMLKDDLLRTDLFSKTQEAEPKDAYISDYQKDKNAYVIMEEVEGSYLNQEVTLQKVGDALIEMQAQLDLETEKCYEQPKVCADNKELQEKLDKMNRYVGSCITYDWNGSEVVLKGDMIKDWIILSSDDVDLDINKVVEYVGENAKTYDTYGKKRKFVTTSGVELTLPSGAYGWKTDQDAEVQALTELIMQGSVSHREPVFSNQGWVKGSDDIGDSYVEVDITHQHLYVYQDGQVVLESDFVSGNMSNGCMTPAGVFGITYKKQEAVLKGQDYESHVHYWMPFNGNIGMHDATWRRKFGGDIYLTGGSHGCINLPLKKAAGVYEYVDKGFPVVCYY